MTFLEGSTMSHERIDRLIWILIFVGLAFIGIGVSIARSDEVIGWAFGAAGALAIVVGATLLWGRSRSRRLPGR